MPQSAIIQINGQRVGRLTQNADLFTFRYDEQWLRTPGASPISLTMPLSAEPYNSHGLHPFFANLLPEGWLLQLAIKQLPSAAEDPFPLLIATCANCIGNLEVLPDESANP